MARYIDCDKCYHGIVCAYRHHYHDMITDCNHHKPMADGEEVRHGEWVIDKTKHIVHAGRKNSTKHISYKCSECGHKVGNNKYFNFCSRCGAKMDGGKEE